MGEEHGPEAIDAWGVASGHHDVLGRWIPASHTTVAALRAVIGTPHDGPPLWFVPQGDEHDLLGPCRVILEEGPHEHAEWGVVTRLPADLPLGYHRLIPSDGGPVTTVVVHPTRCPAPPRAWGLAAQVYALWSAHSWGIGDLGDVSRLAARVASAGGGVLQLSPLHAAPPTFPQEASPYYPSSRRALSPLLAPLDVERRPAGLGIDPSSLIDRDVVWAAKRHCLETEFADARWDPEWREWAQGEGRSLWSVAQWDTIADDHGADWTQWPASLRHPDDPTFARRAGSDPAVAERLEFHAWCQWRTRRALEQAATTGVGLIADLAVGFAPHGADAWEFQDVLALDARIGAPPDVFNPDGQDWGLPPFVPWRLRAAGYRPFIETLRSCMARMAGLRIDHVMGLMRQYWIPVGADRAGGAYVHLPSEEMFALIALEATRAGTFVIGEDLGTVAPEMRDAMSRWGILGTRVVLFEDSVPASYPQMSVATATTHDLPTLTHLWDGGGDARLADRVRHLVAHIAPRATSATEAVDAVHAALLASPARLRLATTDDLCGAIHQPNLPGTVQPANWARPLPVAVDDIPLPDVPRVGLEPTPYGF